MAPLMLPGARLVLASGSPARRALLAAAGLVVEVVVPAVEEGVIKAAMRAEGAGAEEAALALADAKAASVTDPAALGDRCGPDPGVRRRVVRQAARPGGGAVPPGSAAWADATRWRRR